MQTDSDQKVCFFYATSAIFPSKLANRKQILHQMTAFARVRPQMRPILAVSSADDSLRNKDFEVLETGTTFLPLVAFKQLRFVRVHNVTHVYCREIRLAALLCLAERTRLFGKFNLSFEVHVLQYQRRLDSLLLRFLIRSFDTIVTINAWMRDEMIRQRWVRGDNILVAHDAAEPSIFHIQTSQTEARSILGMPRESFVAVYTGRFRPMGMDKGLEAAIRCLSSARAEGVNLVVYAVGGTESEIEIYRNIALAAGVGEYVILVPYSPQEDVARFHIAADVLLMNLPSTDVFFKYYTSPLKLFEYMMAGRAIIASNLPSIQDVVSKEIAFVITPDSDGALSEALITLAKNSALREQLGAAALLESEKYTWDARAQSILDFIT